MKLLKEKWFYFLLLAVFIAVPFFIPNRYFFQIVTISCLYGICTLSLNLILGYTGQPSLAHAGFFGIGAYGVALMTVAGWSFWVALPLSALIAAAIGLVVGIPTLRTRGAYFSIATLCMGVIVTLVATNWLEFTGGANGIVGVPPPNAISLPFIGEIGFESQMAQYYLVLAFLFLTLFVMHRVIFSFQGLAFMAVRNNEALADAVGINTFRAKLLSFVVADFFAGLAGGIYASLIGSISPTAASIEMTFNWLIFVLLGGVGTLAGPIIGTFVLSILMESLQFLQEYSMIIYGFLLIIVIIFFPRGLMGGIKIIRQGMKRMDPRKKTGVENAVKS